jgi:hypothetical protein
MVARERGAGGVDGEDAGARRLRRSRQWERKGAGRARSRRKAAARETGGDKIGRRVDAIFSGSLLAGDPATQMGAQSNTRTTLIVQHRANNPHYPIHIEKLSISVILPL